MTKLFQQLGNRLLQDTSAPFLEQGAVIHTSGGVRDRVSEFAAALKEAGIVANKRVAVALPMGVDFLAAVLAIWRLGSSYVPLPPDEALSRSQSMARVAGVSALVAKRGSPLFGGDAPFASVEISSDGGLQASRGPGGGGIDAPREAYVIFTSGSTGVPKGVSISRAALDFYWRNAIACYQLPETGWRIPLALPATFDASLTSILALLTTRNVGTVFDPVSPTSDLANLVRRDPQRLFLKTTPSQLRLLGKLLDAQSARRATGLFVVGGEQLLSEDFAAFHGNGGLMIFNEYGPTEATVGCIVHTVDTSKAGRGPVPIGRPFAGVGTLFDPVGDGDLAELILSGPSLADGYVNPDVPSGFFEHEGCRFYATGDLVRRDHSTGDLHFVGRRDNQVKLNGFRIELSEIEAALSEVAPDAANVAAIVIGDRLVGVVAGESNLDPNVIKARLSDLLPSYMMPDELRFVDALSVTAHGKLDRAALQERLSRNEKEQASAPQDGLAELAAKAWTYVLRGPTPSPKSNFFASGGDSVAALRLIGRLASLSEGRLPVTLLFDYPEFGAFVSALARSLAGEPDPTQTTEDEVAKAVRLSANQLAMVTGHVASTEKSAYTVCSAVEVTGIEDWTEFSAAARLTVSCHDVFRWRICEHKDWGAAACPASSVGMDVQIEFSDAGSGVEDFLFSCRQTVVDLFQPSLVVGFRVLETGPKTAVVTMITHHCFVDELSVSLLWREIFDRLSGKVPVESSPFSYRAWSERRLTGGVGASVTEATRRKAAHIGGIYTSARIPMRAAENPSSGEVLMHAFRIPQQRIDDTRLFAGAMSTSATTVLSAAAGWTLSRFLGVTHFVNHAPVTQRRSEAEFGAVGCFVANLPSVFVAPSPGSPSVEIVNGWHSAVTSLLEDSDSDPVELETLLQARTGIWDRALRASVAVEQGFGGTSGDVAWASVPMVAGAPKFDLVWTFLLGPNDGSATVRIVARPDIRGVDMAALEVAFAGTLGEILRPGGRAPGLDDLLRSASVVPVPFTHAIEAADLTWLGNQQAMALAEKVADACSETLGVLVPIDGDLFLNGLKSLSALKLVARLRALGHPQVSVADIYEFRTPIRIAQYMTAQEFLP